MKRKHLWVSLLITAVIMIPTALVLAEPLLEDENFSEELPRSIDAASTDSSIGGLKIRGVWGYSGDKDPDGYLVGKVTKRGKQVIFQGVFNQSGKETRFHIVGLLKKGFLNGKITVGEKTIKITGLYRINKEKHLLRLRWLTPHNSGWAVGKIFIY